MSFVIYRYAHLQTEPHLWSEQDRLLVKVQQRLVTGACEVDGHSKTRHAAHTSAVHPPLQDLSVKQGAVGATVPVTESTAVKSFFFFF